MSKQVPLDESKRNNRARGSSFYHYGVSKVMNESYEAELQAEEMAVELYMMGDAQEEFLLRELLGKNDFLDCSNIDWEA